MSIEAMKQAIEALETTSSYATAGWVEKAHREAITSLRQAIAEAEKHTLSGRINDARVHAEYDKQRDAAMKLIEAEKQEPVMGVEVKRIASGGFVGNVWWIHENLQEGVFHLYTHPQPKRELVGLTEDEIALLCGECAASAHNWNDISFARAIEAKLKEKMQ